MPTQTISDFTFSWSCEESRDVQTGKVHDGCLLGDGSKLTDLDSESGASISITPFTRNFRPKTAYTFQVSVTAKIGDPANPLTRLFLDAFFVTKYHTMLIVVGCVSVHRSSIPYMSDNPCDVDIDCIKSEHLTLFAYVIIES